MTVTTEQQAPATRGEALATDLLNRGSITYNDRYLYPALWNAGMKDAFRAIAQRLADDGIHDRWAGHGSFANYDAIDRYLEERFSGTPLAGLTGGYPQVMSRWYYMALERVRNMTFPEPVVEENAAPIVAEQIPTTRPAIGSRWRIRVDNNCSSTFRVGDIVEVSDHRSADENTVRLRIVTPSPHGGGRIDGQYVRWAEALEAIPGETVAPVAVTPHPEWTDITQPCPQHLTQQVFTEGTRWVFVDGRTSLASKSGSECVIRPWSMGSNWGAGANEYLAVEFVDDHSRNLVYLADLRPIAPSDPKDVEIARLTAEVTRLTAMVEAARTALNATEIVF